MKKNVLKILLLVILTTACNSKEREATKRKKRVGSDSAVAMQKGIVPIVSENINNQDDTISNSLKLFLQQADTLRRCYQLLTENRSEAKYEGLFFEAFPNDFETLYAIYGNKYLEENIEELPIESYFEHIGLLYNLDQKNQEAFYRKIIEVSLGGKWEADGINVFQHNLKEKVLTKPKLTFDILQKEEDADIISFFFFFFDGPHPPEEVPKEFNELQESHSRIYNLSIKGLVQAKEPHQLN